MKGRTRVLACIGVIVLLHLAFVSFRHHLESPVPEAHHREDTLSARPVGGKVKAPEIQVDPKPAVLQDGTEKTEDSASPYCQYNDCLKGHWIPREPRYNSLDDLAGEFGGWDGCEVPEPEDGTTRTAEETAKLRANRMVNMMNWVWKSDHGDQKVIDVEDFVVRLLKTPAGIMFIGDSVTAAHEHAFGSLLIAGGVPFLISRAIIHGNETNDLRHHVLPPNHPMTLKLQKKAGVPDSRLLYPIFTIIEDHMLIHHEDVRPIVESHGAQIGFPWFLSHMRRVEGWPEYMANITAPRKGEESSVTDDSILVMNTGAHWSRGTLYMLPHRETLKMEHDALLAVYKDVMKVVISWLEPMQQLKILYRSTSPAHPGCTEKKGPYKNFADAFKNEKDYVDHVTEFSADVDDRNVKLRWDWDRFNVHNDLWRREVVKLQGARAALEKYDPTAHLGPKWLFVDFWEMSLQRPDAHSDCLHWCLPTMYSEWTRHLYHLLYLEEQK